MEPPICQDNLGRSYIPFQLPISLITCGSAFSGKSTFTAQLIDNKSKMFSPEPVEIIYVYSTWQPIYDSLEKANTNIKFINAIPSKSEVETMTADLQHRLMIIDDQMTQLKNCPDITEYFTVFTHHRNLSCILVLQNALYQAQCVRDISYNVQGMIIFRNLRSPQQIGILASQMFPGKKRKFFLDAYDKACLSRQYGYLYCDINPRNDTKFQLRADILPGQDTIIYLPKSS